ncbi:MAG: TPR repeat protein [Alteromonadaceae bacterium]|jgi:TPR repeat protein
MTEQKNTEAGITEPKVKVPSQFFQWFESLKQGYESSIHKLFSRVEAVNDDHKKQMTSVYQSQIDSLKTTQAEHLDAITTVHKSQADQTQSRIHQLEKDASFYQDQIKNQNQTIDKLNARYDAVIFALKDKLDNKELQHLIKDISPSNNAIAAASQLDGNKNDEKINKTADTAGNATQSDAQGDSHNPNFAEQDEQTKDLSILDQAFDARGTQDYEQAYKLFLSAAKLGNEKAMGAIGRAHFVGEGTYLDKPTGLAWLILAGENNFAPAIKKIDSVKIKSPVLYQQAVEIAVNLINAPSESDEAKYHPK